MGNASSTIDYAIHLGLEHAAIACAGERKVVVCRNAGGDEFTPCAVWLNSASELVIGREAWDQRARDPENAIVGFLRDIGSGTEYTFARNQRRVRSEDLIAEIIRSLRADAERETGQVVRAAVLAVPAAFGEERLEALQAAARLGGLAYSPMVPEPVAAGLAYDGDQEIDGTTWLVYDLHGNAFEASLIRNTRGRLELLRHDADSAVSATDIERAVVERLFLPALCRQHRLNWLQRGTPEWQGIVNALRALAGTALQQLVPGTTVPLRKTGLCADDNGDAVDFAHDLLWRDLEPLVQPLLRRTVALCRSVLDDRHVEAKTVPRLLVVGRAGLMPLVQHYLKDPERGLGIPLALEVDPPTAVARGAARFAGTRPLPENLGPVVVAPSAPAPPRPQPPVAPARPPARPPAPSPRAPVAPEFALVRQLWVRERRRHRWVTTAARRTGGALDGLLEETQVLRQENELSALVEGANPAAAAHVADRLPALKTALDRIEAALSRVSPVPSWAQGYHLVACGPLRVDGGEIHVPGHVFTLPVKPMTGFQIELINEDTDVERGSGRVRVEASGAFNAVIAIATGKPFNELRAVLRDSAGVEWPLVPSYVVVRTAPVKTPR